MKTFRAKSGAMNAAGRSVAPMDSTPAPVDAIGMLRRLRVQDGKMSTTDWSQLCGIVDRGDPVRSAAQALVDDVRARHPGEDLRCPHMIALDEALKSVSA